MHLAFLSMVSIVVVLSGCTPHSYRSFPEKPSNLSGVASPSLGSAIRVGSEPTFSASGSSDTSDLERLALLWQKRTQEHNAVDYPIGPGDLLEVNVAAIAELNNRPVRVSGEGTITLPFVGVMQASGLSEEELRKEIHHRLEQYMHRP